MILTLKIFKTMSVTRSVWFGPEKGRRWQNGAVAAAVVCETKQPCPGCLLGYISCSNSEPFSGFLEYILLKLPPCCPPCCLALLNTGPPDKIGNIWNLVPLGASPVSDPLQDDSERERSDPGRGDTAISRRWMTRNHPALVYTKP